VDTWGWLSLRDRSESCHDDVKEFYCRFREQRGIIFTSDYVMDETITLLFKRLQFASARESLAGIEKAVEEGYLLMERIDNVRFEKARELRLKYQDKPGISFTDFTSMVVMNELGIRDIVTHDEHFQHVGMGFQQHP